jgi:hypothetical protein
MWLLPLLWQRMLLTPNQRGLLQGMLTQMLKQRGLLQGMPTQMLKQRAWEMETRSLT